MLQEEKVTSQSVLKGKIIEVRTDKIRLPSGRLATRDVVYHPGAVAILPISDDGQILLVKQFRYATGEALIEVPAGTLEKGETPRQCAARELIEETGHRAKILRKLTECYAAPGYSSEIIHIFYARGLIPARGTPDFDEFIEPMKVTPERAINMILSNQIKDAKTICSMLMAMKRGILQVEPLVSA